MWGRSERQWVKDRVKRVRDHRRRQGHDLSPLQQGLVEAVATCDPAHQPSCREELSQIERAIGLAGVWENRREWRISTELETRIRFHRDASKPYEVTVACDGQALTCRCPSLDSAYSFKCLYEAIIIDQFYTIGPPWAGAA